MPARGSIPDVGSIADHWWNEDRRDLFRAAQVIASGASGANRVQSSLDVILNDLELYDDPRQGAGAWLYDDELQLAEKLGEELHNVVTLRDRAAAQATARALLEVMDRNGDYRR